MFKMQNIDLARFENNLLILKNTANCFYFIHDINHIELKELGVPDFSLRPV